MSLVTPIIININVSNGSCNHLIFIVIIYMNKLEHIKNIINHNQESYIANQHETLKVNEIDDEGLLVDCSNKFFHIPYSKLKEYDILIPNPSNEYINSLMNLDNIELKDGMFIIKGDS